MTQGRAGTRGIIINIDHIFRILYQTCRLLLSNFPSDNTPPFFFQPSRDLYLSSFVGIECSCYIKVFEYDREWGNRPNTVSRGHLPISYIATWTPRDLRTEFQCSERSNLVWKFVNNTSRERNSSGGVWADHGWPLHSSAVAQSRKPPRRMHVSSYVCMYVSYVWYIRISN